MSYSQEERSALMSFLRAAQETAEVFDVLSPWGVASSGIAYELKTDLRRDLREQPQRGPDVDHGPPSRRDP